MGDVEIRFLKVRCQVEVGAVVFTQREQGQKVRYVPRNDNTEAVRQERNHSYKQTMEREKTSQRTQTTADNHKCAMRPSAGNS